MYKFNKETLNNFDNKYNYSGSVENWWVYGEDVGFRFAITPCGEPNEKVDHWAFIEFVEDENDSIYRESTAVEEFYPESYDELVMFIEHKKRFKKRKQILK